MSDLTPNRFSMLLPTVPGPAAVAPGKPDPLSAIQTLSADDMAHMEALYDNPASRPKGETTHIDAIDAHFRWVPGYTNLLIAKPGRGKSELDRLFKLLRAVYAAKKSLNFVPEDMPKHAWYDSIIHALTGQNPDPESENPLPKIYYKRAMEWVREYFYVVVCPKGMGKTPEHILDIFEAGRAKLGIEHFTLDPWNKADHSGLVAAGGFQPYLVKNLGLITDWTQENQVYTTLIAHPKGGDRRRPGEAFAVPDAEDASGGPTFNDMMHSVSALDRPNMHITRNDPAVGFYQHKIKSHRRMGAKPGSIGEGSENPDVLITYDWRKNRYTFNGVDPLHTRLAQSLYAPELTQLADAQLPPSDRYDPNAGLNNSAFEEEYRPMGLRL